MDCRVKPGNDAIMLRLGPQPPIPPIWSLGEATAAHLKLARKTSEDFHALLGRGMTGLRGAFIRKIGFGRLVLIEEMRGLRLC